MTICTQSMQRTRWPVASATIGRIRLSVSTVNRTYELSGITHVTSLSTESTENIRLGPVLTDRESIPTATCSPVSPFLRFVVTEPSRMKSIRTEGCHVGLFRVFVGTACCNYGQSNTNNVTESYWVAVTCRSWEGKRIVAPAMGTRRHANVVCMYHYNTINA